MRSAQDTATGGVPATPIKPSVKVRHTLMHILFILTGFIQDIHQGRVGGAKAIVPDLRKGEDCSSTLVLPSLTSFVWAKDSCTIIQPGHCYNVCVHLVYTTLKPFQFHMSLATSQLQWKLYY